MHGVSLSLPFVWKLGVDANQASLSGALRVEETNTPLPSKPDSNVALAFLDDLFVNMISSGSISQ